MKHRLLIEECDEEKRCCTGMMIRQGSVGWALYTYERKVGWNESPGESTANREVRGRVQQPI